jgi:hypothetical protein
MFSCGFEESRLTIVNPEALTLYLSKNDWQMNSGTLITYPSGEGKLIIVSDHARAKHIVYGKIDMLGVKTYTSYPLRFNFVAKDCTIPFIQRQLSPAVEVESR